MVDEEVDVSSVGCTDSVSEYRKLSFWGVVPKVGRFLGLDISKNSTGVCLIEDGVKVTGNISLTKEMVEIKNSDKWFFCETLLRRCLKKDLTELVSGKEFDLIIIEDAFSGENPEVSRMLYGLNTAIDELILDGVCSCKTFLRVSNKEWKSWIGNTVDPMNKNKGLNDKVKIQNWLDSVGVSEGNSEGFQDRLDATGLILGYFLEKAKVDRKYSSGLNISWSRLEFSYEVDPQFLFEDNEWLKDLEVVYLNDERFTKRKILEYVKSSPRSLFISLEPVYLGMLSKYTGVDVSIDGGGYFAFWVKKSVRKKLFGEE